MASFLEYFRSQLHILLSSFFFPILHQISSFWKNERNQVRLLDYHKLPTILLPFLRNVSIIFPFFLWKTESLPINQSILVILFFRDIPHLDRKSTRLNSSHANISYA